MKIINKKIAAKKSSVAWLQRQASDPYVARAQKDGYRARAAYKLIEMNDLKIVEMNQMKQLQEIVKQATRSTDQVLFLSGVFPSGKRANYAVDLTQE